MLVCFFFKDCPREIYIFGVFSLYSDTSVRVSVPLPSVKTSALAYGAFLGLSGNLRYQFLCGAERVMEQHFNHIGAMVFCSTLLRYSYCYRWSC